MMYGTVGVCAIGLYYSHGKKDPSKACFMGGSKAVIFETARLNKIDDTN